MQKFLLIVILIFSACLRLWDLQSTPRGLYIDEISIGWNTHLISTTARDEYAQFLPLNFKAYGENKLPAYIYATVPIFMLFGPGIFQLRLVSALSGIIASFAVYLLCLEIFSSHSKSNKSKHFASTIALLSATLFAITPWSIQLSRAAFEANFALTSAIFAIYFLLKLRTVSKDSILYLNVISCLFSFALSFYGYNSFRLLLPLQIILILYLYRASYTQKITKIVVSLLALISLPAIYGFVFANENTRAVQVHEFGHKQLELGPFMGTLYKYFNHLNADFLFFIGDNLGRHSVRELGVLPLPLIIFLPIGLYVLISSLLSRKQQDISPQSVRFILMSLLLAPIPSAITTPSPHALRAIFMLPLLIITSAIGIYTLYQLLTPKIYQTGFTLLSICAFSYALLTYQHVYYVHWSPQMWPEWSEHWTKAASYIANTYPQSPRVFLEDSAQTTYYMQFFDTVARNSIKRQIYPLNKFNEPPIPYKDGDIIGILGYKQAPPELTSVHEITAANQMHDIIYKIGEWHEKK